MEVRTEKYQLQNQTLYFRWNARAGIIYQRLAKAVPQIEGSIEDSLMLAYAGTVAGMMKEKQPFEIGYEEYVDIVDDQIEVINALFERMNPQSKEKKKK